MNKAKWITLALLLAAAGLVAALFLGGRPAAGNRSKPVMMFCAAGMKEPLTEIARRFEEECGTPVQLQFGGSGALLGNLQVAPGDLFLAADATYIDLAREKGLVEEVLPVAFLTGGIGVSAGNPRGIRTLDDLKRDDVRLGIANPDAASIGRTTREVLTQAGLWEVLSKRVTLTTPTVNDLANAVKLKSVDAVIVWDAVAGQYPEIEFIRTPEFDRATQQVTLGVLTACKQPAAALRFARYVTARDRGLPVFAKDGYVVTDGDVWKQHPDILLYSGAMLRPAIEQTLKAFEEREGVTIRPVYNGCGILVSQMKAGENPDAYFSCDVKFMDMVIDRFGQPVTVSGNDMIIMVGKGNPKNIRGVEDLKNPGLRLGFAHPEKSALGFLAKDMLEKTGLYQAIVDSGNIKLDSPTGDFLVNQLRAGSLDGVIVYRSNALSHPSTLEDCDVVDIALEGARALQPWAVGLHSEHKHLMDRLYRRLVSSGSRDAFKAIGFHWELGE